MENGFGAFAEAFEFFGELLEEFQARGALGEVAVDLLEFFLRFAEFLREVADLDLQVLRFGVRAGLGDLGLLGAGADFGEGGGGLVLLDAHALDLGGERVVALGGGFLIHLVAGGVGAKAGDVALELEELELGLGNFLLVFL